MGWADVVSLSVLAPIIAGLLLILLAVWIAYLDFENRLHRSLALFLFLRGLANLGSGFLAVPDWNPFWTRVTPYFGIALPLAALHFAYRYHVDRARARPRAWVVPLLVVSAILVEALYLLDHGMFTARNTEGRIVFGPLFLSVGALYVVYALIASRFVRDYLAPPPRNREPSLLVTALAFALLCVNTGLYYFVVFLPGPPNLPGSGTSSGRSPPVAAILAGVMLAASFLVLIPSVVRMLRDRHRSPEGRRPVDRALLLLVAPGVTALIAAGAGIVSQSASISLVLVFGSFWTLSFGILLTYALVRHRLFDIDARLRVTVRRGTVAAFFVTVFFTVGELTQNYLTDEFDWVVGTVVTGLLLFLLHPITRIADRVASATIPDARASSDLTRAERLALYADQARIAWADGSLTRKERLLLDHTRQRLGIAPEEAHRLEAAALSKAA